MYKYPFGWKCSVHFFVYRPPRILLKQRGDFVRSFYPLHGGSNVHPRYFLTELSPFYTIVFKTPNRCANRNFGRMTLALMCCGPVLLRASSLFWSTAVDGSSTDLKNLQIQIISINSSNLLILMMRAALIISLLYFVHASSRALAYEQVACMSRLKPALTLHHTRWRNLAKTERAKDVG